jgi:hypothetical protein
MLRQFARVIERRPLRPIVPTRFVTGALKTIGESFRNIAHGHRMEDLAPKNQELDDQIAKQKVNRMPSNFIFEDWMQQELLSFEAYKSRN